MQNISDKADSTAGATGELTASEYNNHKNELQGAVTRTAQALSAATLLQLSKALFINGAGATSVQDSGSGDSIILSPVTGASGLVAPDDYAHFDGGLLSFDKSSPNTTTAVTVNFGQTGTELGAKSLRKSDGSLLDVGEVRGRCIVIYNISSDEWRLLDTNSGSTVIPDKDISSGNKITDLTVYESGGGSEKPDGFNIKISWIGGDSSFNHSFSSGYTIGSAVSGFLTASLWIGHGQGELSLELDKVNSRWIVVNHGTWDYGLNSNGYWWKSSDRSQKIRTINISIITAATIYTFPIPFSDLNYVVTGLDVTNVGNTIFKSATAKTIGSIELRASIANGSFDIAGDGFWG